MAGRQRDRPEGPPSHRSKTTADGFRSLATAPRPKCCRLQRRPQPAGCPSPPGCLTRSPAQRSTARAPATRDPPELAARCRIVGAPRCQVEGSERTGYLPEVGDSGPPPTANPALNQSGPPPAVVGPQLMSHSRVAAFPLVGFGADVVSGSSPSTIAISSSPWWKSDGRARRRRSVVPNPKFFPKPIARALSVPTQ